MHALDHASEGIITTYPETQGGACSLVLGLSTAGGKPATDVQGADKGQLMCMLAEHVRVLRVACGLTGALCMSKQHKAWQLADSWSGRTTGAVGIKDLGHCSSL